MNGVLDRLRPNLIKLRTLRVQDHQIMKRKPTPSAAVPTLDMSPMIDLSFLLLIYFLVTSTLEPMESDLALTLPGRPSPGTHVIDFDPIKIEVNGEGAILIEGEVLDTNVASRELPLLLDRLRTYAESARLTDNRPRVMIAAADGSKGQRFVDVLNALASRGVEIEHVMLENFLEE